MAGGFGGKLIFKNVMVMVVFGVICLVFVFFGLLGCLGVGVGVVGWVNNILIFLVDF